MTDLSILCPTCGGEMDNVDKSMRDEFERWVSDVLSGVLKELTITDKSNPSYHWDNDRRVQIIIRFPSRPIGGDDWDRIFDTQHLVQNEFEGLDIRFYHTSDSEMVLPSDEK